MNSLKQNGRVSIGNIILVFCLALLLTVLAYGYTKASVSSVQEVLTTANGSADAIAKVKIFLSEHPNPNNSELSKLRTEVNALVIHDLAHKLTNNPTLKTDAGQAAEKAHVVATNDAKDHAQSDQDIALWISRYLWEAMLLASVLLIGALIFKAYIQFRDVEI